MKTIAFTGHRFDTLPNPEFVKTALVAVVNRAIAKGYTQFITGLASGVDQIGLHIIADLKKQGVPLTLIGARPFDTHGYDMANRLPNPYYQSLLKMCDKVVVVSPGEYRKDKYYLRDKWMVDQADAVIAVYDGRPKGGTKITFDCAKKVKKPIYWLNPETKVESGCWQLRK